ncbi:hypothetical protein AB3662_18545 [Sorangium cellulosum]|uniref:hypothetical protein n=1 Tax=Sorangium cellulosum TaxID=56 RepID=UPI003D9A36BD
MNLRPGARALVLLSLCAAACGGPPSPSPIEGEPVCPDFEIGATRAPMRGSLRFPVTLTVLEGGDPITRTTITGRRSSDDPATRILLADDDAEYEIQWAQCENQRAPRARTLARDTKDTAEYACGNAAVYKTDKLVTRKGDAASRRVHFAAPPKPECWESELPAADSPPAPPAVPDQPPPDAAPDAEPAADAATADAGATGKATADAGAASTGARGAAPTGATGTANAGATGAGAASARPAGAAAAPADAGVPRGDAGAGGPATPPRTGGGDAGSPPQGS